jgi:hypothetical protein
MLEKGAVRSVVTTDLYTLVRTIAAKRRLIKRHLKLLYFRRLDENTGGCSNSIDGMRSSIPARIPLIHRKVFMKSEITIEFMDIETQTLHEKGEA